MSTDIRKALRAEVERIARKEIRAQTSSMKKAVARYRSDIAELKRQQAGLEKRLNAVVQEEKRRLEAAPAATLPEPGKQLRFSPKNLKKHREKLGLSAADYARLAGVHPISIYNWENGKSKPSAQKLASLAALRNLGKRELKARLSLLDN